MPIKNLFRNQKLKNLFTDITASVLASPLLHKENIYVDYNAERLIPYMLSTQGPKLTIGDVNKDGLEDFYIGGAANEPRKLIHSNRIRVCYQ